MKSALALITIGTLSLLLGATPVLALNPSLEVSQYGHTSWTARDGYSIGATFAIAQTPDGYLWLGSEFGLYRFDGTHVLPWQPPAGQQLPNKPYALLVSHDGILWIGTFAGLVSWDGANLTQYPEVGKLFITSLHEDREGTVWVGTYGDDALPSRLCAIRGTSIQCYGLDRSFGSFVWSLAEDRAGTLWVGADSGLWRWKPDPPKRYATSRMRITDLAPADDTGPLVGVTGTGLKRLIKEKLEPYPIHNTINPSALLPDHEIDANKLLWDRDGGLWIGTHQHGLIHVHNGKTDIFTKADGLSGDISCSLFEDREGNVWFASAHGLDLFRELPVTTISVKQGLSSDVVLSVLATSDGSVWLGSGYGLTRLGNEQTTIFRKANGLPADSVQSLFEDKRGRLWASFSQHPLSYLKDARFVDVPGVPSEEVYSIAGDDKDNIWLSGNKGLSHVRDGRLVETFPWLVMGRHQQAKVVIPDQGGVWLAFWVDGGVLYFKDGQVRASYTPSNGLGAGEVSGLRLDRDGALWAATQKGGLSRIKDGRVSTLTTKNGLPCDTIHWSIEADDGSLWLYSACGLVRIRRSELDTWIADPTHIVQTTVWDAADGVRLLAVSPAYFNPPVAKDRDGKLWFNAGEGIAVIDPRHIAFNKVPPPVHITQIVADHKLYWQNLPGAAVSSLRLPARTRDLEITYTALSLVAPEKIHFKFKLEGQDQDWREVVNDRQVQYSNLRPGSYRFRVIAANDSGVWNEQGDTLEFSIAPAYYQTNWFRAFCAVLFLALLWAVYEWRVRRLHHEFEMTLDARVGERTRIARDLHDTLLQGAHGLLLRFETVSQLLPEHPTEAKERLESVINQTSQFVTEARNEVQGLRESTIQGNDLAFAISTLGEELTTDPASQRPMFRVAVEGQARDLHPIIRDEIYKIAAEALRNAFRHAQARQVEVELRYDDDQFRLRVRDDGRGIDPAIASGKGSEGHYGLRGMRERATLMGGKLVVWSEIDVGTEVELRVPGHAAYATAWKGSWLSQKFARKAKA